MKTVLFACVHNAGRSQMAASWFNMLADPAKARAIRETARVEDIDGLPTINLSETPLEGWSRFVKRVPAYIVALFVGTIGAAVLQLGGGSGGTCGVP